MDFDYKKYSLENLENWLHDAMSSGEATPDEIYDLIMKVVRENYYHHKHHASQAYELLALLNSGVSNNKYQDYLNEILSCDKDDPSPDCKKEWTKFWEEPNPLFVSEDGDLFVDDIVKKGDKVVKWQLPVEVDGLTGDCYIQFPDDLLEAADLKEGDQIEWIDRNDGSFELRKVNGTK